MRRQSSPQRLPVLGRLHAEATQGYQRWQLEGIKPGYGIETPGIQATRTAAAPSIAGQYRRGTKVTPGLLCGSKYGYQFLPIA